MEVDCLRLFFIQARMDSESIDLLLRTLHQPGFRLSQIPGCYSEYRRLLNRRSKPKFDVEERLVTVRRKLKQGHSKMIESKSVGTC